MNKIMNNKKYIIGLVIAIIAIIGVITLIVVNNTPKYIGTWVQSNGQVLKISKDKIISNGTSVDFEYNDQEKLMTFVKDGQTKKAFVNKANTDKNKLEMELLNDDGTTTNYDQYLYRQGTKLANSAQASSKKLVADQKVLAKKEAAKQAELHKLFKSDKRHIVELINGKYYFTTWTKQQITTESAKLRRQSLDINKQADDKFGQFAFNNDLTDKIAFTRDTKRSISSTLGTSITFASMAYQDDDEDTSLDKVIPDPTANVDDDKSYAPKAWYENALTAEKAKAITTTAEYNKIIK